MNHKKLIFFGVIFLLSFQLKAQIANEIRSYVDSTEILVNNGRRLLLDEIRIYNYSKALDIYTYLNNQVANNNCQAFSFNEHLMISVLTSDWSQFLRKAEHFGTERRTVCYQNMISIENELYEKIMKYFDVLQKRLSDANLSPQESKLIELYFLALNLDSNRNLYDAEIKLFKKMYSDSDYNDFIVSYLPSPLIRASMSFGMGTATALPLGNLSDYLKSGIGFQVDWDFSINKMYFSLNVATTPLTLTSNFYATSDRGDSFSFYPGDKLSYFQGGVKGGYYLMRSNRFNLAPFVQLGGSSLTSNLYSNPEDKKNELTFFDSFFIGPGIHSELKLYEYKGSNMQSYYGNPPGYFSLKLDAGYNIFTNQKIEEVKGNILYAALTLVWGIGSF